MKILIGTPAYNHQVLAPFVSSLLALTRVFHTRGVDYDWSALQATVVSLARNLLATQVLDGDFTHLLFIDSDVSFRSEAVTRMIDFGRDVAACAYPRREIDLAAYHAAASQGASPSESLARALSYPVVFSQPPAAEKGFFRSVSAPAGLMLIGRQVFEQLRDRHPELYVRMATPLGPKRLLQCFEPVYENGAALSEDISFCRRWNAAGGEIWTLVEEPTGHTGPYTFSGAAATKMAAKRR